MKMPGIGGACYGYENLPVFTKNGNGEQVKSHTDYLINEEQAEVIRAIYRAYADGYGHTTIAKALNRDLEPRGPKGDRRSLGRSELEMVRKRYFDGLNTAAPVRGKRGTGSWAPSAIREILYRERYAGTVPFASTKAKRPDLRIVYDELWKRVQRRLKDVRETYIRDGGHWWGKPSSEKYLLTGMARCADCGKTISIIGGKSGSGTRRKNIFYYGCSYYHTRGETVCENNHRARMEWLDAAVIQAIEGLLTPEALAYTEAVAKKEVMRALKENPVKHASLMPKRARFARSSKDYYA
jgi:hypothetical protein